MAKLSFKTLSFEEHKNSDKRRELERKTGKGLQFKESQVKELQVNLLRLFYTMIPFEEVEKISPFKIIDAHTIEFIDINQEKAEKKFSFLLAKYFANLKNKLTDNPATYIHQNSEIPLIGNVSFGIVYRNSSIIEIKPITSCNLDCVYCSISEGLSSKKHDFVVEKDYLIEELKKLISFVDEKVEVHIGMQGEPFLYADIEELIAEIETMENVHSISIDTNGTLLNKKIIDNLAKNKKLHINFSLDSLDKKKARLIAGTKGYDVNQIKEIISYASEKFRREIIVAPVFVEELNKEDIEDIIIFVKSLKKQPILGIQNFLRYKTGRNPSNGISFEKFYAWLEELEKKYNIKLKLNKEFFNVRKTKLLPKPFQEEEVITAALKCPDRFPNTSIAVAQERNISVLGCPFKSEKNEKKVKIKIIRDKHNIFAGKLL
ncbi:MAG: radical SAM protein [Nanoarchaeota archaeon]|nr:radical SAM protein [Nanoarchaeota archaeon]